MFSDVTEDIRGENSCEYEFRSYRKILNLCGHLFHYLLYILLFNSIKYNSVMEKYVYKPIGDNDYIRNSQKFSDIF